MAPGPAPQKTGRSNTCTLVANRRSPSTSRGRSLKPALMRFWSVNLEPATGVVSNPFGLRGYRTQLGETDYANCILPADTRSIPPKPLRYTFFKYRVSGDTLDVWGMDFEETGRVIEAGTLDGETERDDDGKLNRAFLTATTDELTAYLKNGGDAVLFPEDHRGTYVRQAKPPLDRR